MKRTKQDIAWSEAIRKRDKYTCVMCGNKGKVQAHHVIPRTVKELRHEELNGVTLCFSCHKVGRKSAHQNAIYFAEWFKENRPEEYKYLMSLCRNL